jgi:hypothetical protein
MKPPMHMPIKNAKIKGRPCVERPAATHPDKAITPPTDRSRLPLINNKVKPQAVITTIVTCRSTFIKFLGVKNASDMKEKTIPNNTSIEKVMSL